MIETKYQDEMTERHILGAFLYDFRVFQKHKDVIEEDLFFDPLNRKIFITMKDLLMFGINPQLQSVISQFKTNGYGDQIEYLNILARDPGIFSEIASLIKHLQMLKQFRKIEAFEYELLQKKKTITHLTPQAYFAELNKSVSDFSLEFSKDEIEKNFHSCIDIEKRFFTEEEPKKLKTSLLGLDEIINGFRPGNLIIVAARTGVGKTSFVLNLISNIAEQFKEGEKILMFSLEMSSLEIYKRLASLESGVLHSRIIDKTLTERESEHLKTTGLHTKNTLVLSDSTKLSIQDMVESVKKFAHHNKVGLVVVDYLQLLHSDNKKHSIRTLEIGEITRLLKSLAKELQIPVVALSQLSRPTEAREKKRPSLTDLRDSGSIEQDADVVLLLYRPSMSLLLEEPKPDTADHAAWQDKMREVENNVEVLVAKNRHGITGVSYLKFFPEVMKFEA